MEAVTLSPEVQPEIPAARTPWPLPVRVAFRFFYGYAVLYALCCGNATLWALLPLIGNFINNNLNAPFTLGGQWLAQHWFHVQGAGAKVHLTGSGDTAIQWLALGLYVLAALLITLVWSILDRRRTDYRGLLPVLRMILRAALCISMLNYGFAKVFPLQMPPPSLAVLNEPLGNSSPMTLLWTLIGLHPGYEMICGAAEILAGVLVLFRRTALAGAMLTAFVMSNVLLYNLFFDVPVKIYAANLVLIAVVVIAPDVPALWSFFILHRPTPPMGAVAAPRRRWLPRYETPVLAVLLVIVCAVYCFALGVPYSQQRANMAHPPVISGLWKLDAATLANQPHPYATGDGLPMTGIAIEPTGRVMVRASDGELWRGNYKLDISKHTLAIFSIGHGRVVYSYAMPDTDHIQLAPTGEDAKTESSLTLSRIPTPSSYPLLTRGFPLVNEWGLER